MSGQEQRVIPVIQGEFRVSDRPGDVLSTILGSCVAVCLHDPVAKIGGMNHFLLPGDTSKDSSELRYGTNAMELLINSLRKQGAEQSRLVAKVFGGARMIARKSSIGEANAKFAFWFLETEQIPVVSKNTGGDRGRKLRFWPTTGRAQLMLIEDRLVEEVEAPTPRAPATPDDGDVTLF